MEAIEIFIPGVRKPYISRRRWEISKVLWEKYGDKARVIYPMAMAEHRLNLASILCGNSIDFSGENPLRVLIYDYSPKNRGRRMRDTERHRFNISPKYLQRPDMQRFTSAEYLIEHPLLIGHQLMEAGCILGKPLDEMGGGWGYGIDWHWGNLRVTPSGTKSVGDFDFFDFNKGNNTDNLRTYLHRDRFRWQLAQVWENLGGNPLTFDVLYHDAQERILKGNGRI